MSTSKKKAKKAKASAPVEQPPDPGVTRQDAIAAINSRATEADRRDRQVAERRLDSVADLIHENEQNRAAFLAELPQLKAALRQFERVNWQSQPQTQVWSRIMNNLISLRQIVGKGLNNFNLQALLGRAHDTMGAQGEETWRRAVIRRVRSAAPTLSYAKKLVAVLDEDIAKYANQGPVVNHEAQTGEPPPEERQYH